MKSRVQFVVVDIVNDHICLKNPALHFFFLFHPPTYVPIVNAGYHSVPITPAKSLNEIEVTHTR